VRAFVPLGLAAALLFAAPGAAAADVIFDPADADDLAATLAEATATQDVCYGWTVSVSDPVAGLSESVGSNFGAGQPTTSGDCQQTVEFEAYITYTSESSEAEDSATYDVTSSSGGPAKADLDALGLDMDGLTGENPDVVIGNAVTALPLLAADAGLAPPISASPQEGNAPADAQLTDSPGSDWWRNNGGMLLWGLGLLAAGALFAWWVVVINRKRVAAERAANEKAVEEARQKRSARGRRGRPTQQEPVPQYVPSPDPTPPTQPIPAQTTPAPDPATSPLPVPSATTSELSSADEPAAGEPGAEPQAGSEEPATEERGGEGSVAVAEEESAAGEPGAESLAGPEKDASEKQAGGSSAAEESAAETEVAAGNEGSAEESAEAQPPGPVVPSEKDTKPSVQKDKE
jgi:hypothetical protein